MLLSIFCMKFLIPGLIRFNFPNTFQMSCLILLYPLEVVISSKYSFNPPTLGSMAMLLSFRMTSRLELYTPALFKASKAIPPVIAPSPITAMLCRLSSPLILAAIAIPKAAEIEVDECPVPKESYSLSDIFGKPLMPP